MTDDQTPAPEAGDEDIVYNPVEKAEAPENTDGQVKDQPASDGDDAPEGDDDHSEDKKSKSAIRREKRRENEQRLREQAEEATRKAKDAQDRLNRIKSFAESEQEPKESDFEDSFEYSAARALWKQSQRVASREQEEISAEAKRYEEQAAKFEEERRAGLEYRLGRIEDAVRELAGMGRAGSRHDGDHGEGGQAAVAEFVRFHRAPFAVRPRLRAIGLRILSGTTPTATELISLDGQRTGHRGLWLLVPIPCCCKLPTYA